MGSKREWFLSAIDFVTILIPNMIDWSVPSSFWHIFEKKKNPLYTGISLRYVYSTSFVWISHCISSLSINEILTNIHTCIHIHTHKHRHVGFKSKIYCILSFILELVDACYTPIYTFRHRFVSFFSKMFQTHELFMRMYRFYISSCISKHTQNYKIYI